MEHRIEQFQFLARGKIPVDGSGLHTAVQQCWSRALLLLVSCSELLIQLSNQGSISIRSETIQSVTYRWYLDGDLLDEEQNASGETRITIGL